MRLARMLQAVDVHAAGEPGRVVADPAAGQQLPVAVHQGDVVVVFGPVDPAVNIHPSSSRNRSPRVQSSFVQV